MVGQAQNCFCAHRSCGDNIFILNTVLEFNKSKKLLLHLLFVDLKEGFGRSILLLKVGQLNIPDSFITFLRNFYFQDSVSTASDGERTRTQFQKRGLRQGFNLSSVLFILYLSKLSRCMSQSGAGSGLPSG